MAHAQLLEHPRPRAAPPGPGGPAARRRAARSHAASSSWIAAHPVAVGGQRVGQPLQPPRRRPQVALDVGQPRRARGGDEAAEDEPAELASRRRGRAGCELPARSARRARRAPRAPRRAPRDVARRPAVVRSTSSPATWSRSRANPAASHAGPPASAISASTAAAIASSSTARDAAVRRARERELGSRCRAPPARGARAAATSSSSSRRVPARIAAACASGVSSTRTPTVSPSSTSAGIGAHRLAGARQRDAARQRAERPVAQPACARAPRRPPPAPRAAAARLAPQRLEVVALGDDAGRPRPRRGTHPQVRRAGASGRTRRAARARRAAPRARARPRRAAAARAAAAAASTAAATSGTGTSAPPKLLRQRADQRRDELGPQRRARASRSRRLAAAAAPSAGRGRSRRRARRPARSGRSAAARARPASTRPAARAGRGAASPATSSSRREVEQVGCPRRRVAPPAVEVRAGHDLGGDPRVVEVEQRLVVDEDVAPARAVLELLDLLQQPRLAAKNAWRVSQSPSTSARRMNSSRDELRVDPPVGDLAAGSRSAARRASRARAPRPSRACAPSAARRRCA